VGERRRLTELDAGVILPNLVAVVVGKEHVGRQTALRGIGVWRSGKGRRDGPGGLTLLALLLGLLGLALCFLGHDDRVLGEIRD
jgi:hypothetical protein